MVSTSYPDTTNYVLSGCRANDLGYTYSPGDSRFYEVWGQSWDEFLKNIESQTAMLLIYHQDTAKYYFNITGDCSQLTGKHLRRIDVTMDYLNNYNFTITYPD